MFNILGLLKYKIVIAIITAIISIISFKFWQLNDTIKKQAAIIETLKHNQQVLTADLEIERENVRVVKEVVKEQHATIDSLKARNQDIQKKYDDFKKLSDAEKYKSQKALDLMRSQLFASSDCQAGLELNRMISKLHYDDL